MDTVKIKFTDFAETSFQAERHWVWNTLKKRYRVELSDSPDFLFYSTWGLDFLNYDCVRVFCGGEPVSPNFNECDYAFGFEPIVYNDRFMQYPVGDSDSPGLYDIGESIQDRSKVDPQMYDRRFCNFVYSQDWMGDAAGYRREFCKALMQYKHVDCPGLILNNMPAGSIAERRIGGPTGPVSPDWSNGKLEFLKNYKFTIAFENTALAGVTTEKLVQPFQSYSVPIYWGNPDVTKLFNPKAFINCNEYNGDFDAMIARIKEIDEDREKYLEMLSQPPLRPDFDFHRSEKAEEFLFRIIERGNKPFSKDTIHISSSFRLREDLRVTTEKLDHANGMLEQYGCACDSNSWKLLRKMQRFADSKWGYLPKKLFLFLLGAYRKVKGVVSKS